MTERGQDHSASDPQWYRDGVIYELAVRAFADSNGDGVGDFGGCLLYTSDAADE